MKDTAKIGSYEISAVDWGKVETDLQRGGHSLVPGMVSGDDCDRLIAGYDDTIYRKTVVMERHRFGIGEYKYFRYPLPDIVQTLREEVYPRLVPIANHWMEQLGIETRFPPELDGLGALCHRSGQTKPTPLILRYGKGGFNTLHQDLYGDIYFPFQLAIFLNQPDRDYTGGEFVLTQQTARAQSRAFVLRPQKGDMIVFTTNFRPVAGSKGFYRATMKHGVSEITNGVRHTLGVIFHDATS